MSEELREEEIKNEVSIAESERLTGIQVSKIIEDFDQTTYLRNEAYYKGRNPNLIAQGKQNDLLGKDPNNVVPLPFARKTINDLQGYAYKPSNVKYEFEDETPEAAQLVIKTILMDNEEPLNSAEIFQDTAIKGEGAELMYFKNGNILFDKVPREQCIFEYEDTIREDTLKWAMRFYSFNEVQQDGQDIIKHRADVYYPTRVDFYEWEEKGDLSSINQQLGQTRFDFNTAQQYKYVKSELHPFGEVPLYPYQINSDKMGIFQPQIPIIDKLDELGSDSIANAIDQFNDTLLVLSKSIDEADIDKIKEWKVMDDLGGKDDGNFAEFLQRNLNIEATLRSTETFERWYYELTGIPNLNDDKFNVKSGIAIAYALTNFENLVTTMEIYFTRSLKYRLKLINNALMFLGLIGEPVEASLSWTRNLPFDMREKVEVAAILKREGLLSDETILKMFPQTLISDPQEEIKKRDDEKKKAFEDNQNAVAKMIKEPRLPEEDDKTKEGE